ncbi:hypothetical protein LTR36_007281 [Oleoguttula mirabilis]|uniref:Uncharacterized protein n=1 Tax=Oleoguttula mirabilis TaxID=1507867 RepID=A0AAV9J9X3_9PEZI|nr:hypothetical protein LTR36_007281 [Oleoguttula mirabilis]
MPKKIVSLEEQRLRKTSADLENHVRISEDDKDTAIRQMNDANRRAEESAGVLGRTLITAGQYLSAFQQHFRHHF